MEIKIKKVDNIQLNCGNFENKMGITIEDYIEAPTALQVENIRKELGEDPQRLQHMQELLQEWIACQPDFPKNYDKRILANYLRGSKFNLDRTKKKLESLFRCRALYPHLFEKRHPESPKIANILNNVCMIQLPKMTENGEIIHLFKLMNADIDKFDAEAVIRLTLMYRDVEMICKYPTCGHIVIMDYSGFTANHFVKLFPALRQIIAILRDSYAIRLKSLHIVNAPSVVESIVSQIKPFLHKSVRNRFYFHKATATLKDHFPANCLPSDYDGDLPSSAKLHQRSKDMLRSYGSYFMEQEMVKMEDVAMNCRSPNNNINNNTLSNLNGIEGSFRKLDID